MKGRLITYKGVTKTLPDWAREYGQDPQVVSDRIRRGWNMKKALTEPVKVQAVKLYEWRGKQYTVRQLTEMFGDISETTMHHRLDIMSVEDAMTRPLRKRRKAEGAKMPVIIHRGKSPNKTQCRTCIYHGTFGSGGENIYCDYIEVEERRRGCPPSPNCTVYVKGKSVVRKMALQRVGKKVRSDMRQEGEEP